MKTLHSLILDIITLTVWTFILIDEVTLNFAVEKQPYTMSILASIVLIIFTASFVNHYRHLKSILNQ